MRNKGRRVSREISDYVVVAIETTGCYAGCELIELAAVKVRSNKPVSEFNTLLRPEYKIPATVTRINGITNEMVEEAPYIEDVLADFMDFIKDEILIGHSIAAFDYNIIYDYVDDWLGERLANDYIDILYYARNRIRRIENHMLQSLCGYFRVDVPEVRRALPVCYMIQECYQKLKLIKPLAEDSGEADGHPMATRRMIGVAREARALRELQNYLTGVIVDGGITKKEICALEEWMEYYRILASKRPFDHIFEDIQNIVERGSITHKELDYMLKLFRDAEKPLAALESGNINIKGKNIYLTGNFEYGRKAKVEAILTKGGASIDKALKPTTDIVLVGGHGSADVELSNYAVKLRKIIEQKAGINNIAIISEEDMTCLL